MRGAMTNLKTVSKAKQAWLLALCVGGALLSTVSHAGDRHRDDDRRHGRNHVERHHDNWDGRDHDRRDWDRRHRDSRSDWRRDYRPDWHYHSGRYWAPARYRGRYCDDRRHFRGVHYHVAARDYYDYYYPRYRSYGPRPFGANASVIITVPLF